MSANPCATASIYLPIPAGMVIAYMGKPETLDGLAKLGWLLCNGAAVSSKVFPDLYAAIGTTYGGNGAPNFNLPKLEGFFLRGVDPNGHQDPDAKDRTSPIPGVQDKVGPVVGSVQGFAVQNHLHNWWNNFSFISKRGDDLSVQLSEHSPTKGDDTAGPTTMYDGGGNETRPSNVYTYYLVFSGLPQVGERVTASVQMKPSVTRTAKKLLAAKPAKKLAAKPAKRPAKKTAKKAAKKSAGAKKTRKR